MKIISKIGLLLTAFLILVSCAGMNHSNKASHDTANSYPIHQSDNYHKKIVVLQEELTALGDRTDQAEARRVA